MPSCKRIVLILDSSGSMATQKNDIIGGVNEMISQQRAAFPEENNNVFFNIVMFSSYITPLPDNTLESITPLTPETYKCTGSTALYDAMGQTMDRFRNENDVILVIATDGEENCSRQYNHKTITSMVRDFREQKDWNFIYLSEDIDTFKQGSSIGMSRDVRCCDNIAVGKGNLGETMGSSFNNSQMCEIRRGNKNVKMKGFSKRL